MSRLRAYDLLVRIFAEFDHEQLVEGANTMLRVAKEILAAQTARQVNRSLLQDGESSEGA